ncbi:MAG TPA: ferredoxin [Niabella sp.]|jgi:ferredoxin|nr:ferredoxin [Chitinophagaceae bacterium]HRO85110.1 ferredoxin [Niabella sp.]HUN02919.1 ferredoxin [Niabella sp.]
MSKIIHYRNKCIGCGLCHEQQPELWRMSKKDGKATLLNAVQKRETWVLPLNEIHREKLEQVIVGCPVKVIKVL